MKTLTKPANKEEGYTNAAKAETAAKAWNEAAVKYESEKNTYYDNAVKAEAAAKVEYRKVATE